MKHLVLLLLLLAFSVSITSRRARNLYWVYRDALKSVKKVDPDLFNHFAKGSFSHKKSVELLSDPSVERSNWPLVNSIEKVLTRTRRFQDTLRTVGQYLRQHKFLEIDWRKRADKLSSGKLSKEAYQRLMAEDRKLGTYVEVMVLTDTIRPWGVANFTHKFPEPPLVEEHYELSRLCKISAERCISAVKDVIE